MKDLQSSYPYSSRLAGDTLERLSKTIGLADHQLLEQLENALIYRLEGNQSDQEQNTYLKSYDIPQIKLFDILANHFPLVLESQKLAQECLVNEIADCRHICIIDLGIGRSVQMHRILKRLNQIPAIKEVTLIGLDIMPSAIEYSNRLLSDLKKELTYAFNFHLLAEAVEKTDFNNIISLLPNNADFTYVNASLTMHHVQQGKERDKIFKQIRSLSPQLLTLIEPNTSTFTDDFEIRMDRAIEHFYALYHYVDTLSLGMEEKKAVKTFFGNDFFDPIAFDDDARYEKLEKGEEWISRALLSEFSPFMQENFVSDPKIENIDVRKDSSGYMSFSYKGIDLLSLIHLKVS